MTRDVEPSRGTVEHGGSIALKKFIADVACSLAIAN